MAKCPYCNSNEFEFETVQVSTGNGKVSVRVLVCKQCSSLLSLADMAEDKPNPCPPKAFIKA